MSDILTILSRELNLESKPSALLFAASSQQITVATVAEQLDPEVIRRREAFDDAFKKAQRLIREMPDAELKVRLNSAIFNLETTADAWAGLMADTLFDAWCNAFLQTLILRSGLNLRLAESQAE